MPADALARATEQFAPARADTNFFDPTQGESVISRYANNRRGLETSTMVADSESRLLRNRLARSEERRAAMRFDKDEAEYEDRQAFKAQRGEFLEGIAKIDPHAEDYDAQISEVLKNLPAAAMEDDAFKALLTHKNRIADSIRTEKEMFSRRQDQYRNSMNSFGIKEDRKDESYAKRAQVRRAERTTYRDAGERLKNARNGLDPARAAELKDDPELAAYEAGLTLRMNKATDARERADYAALLSGDKADRRDRMSAATDGLSPEEINRHRRDDGSMDWESVAFAAGEVKRQNALETKIAAEDRGVERKVDAEGRAVEIRKDAEDRGVERKIDAEGRAVEIRKDAEGRAVQIKKDAEGRAVEIRIDAEGRALETQKEAEKRREEATKRGELRRFKLKETSAMTSGDKMAMKMAGKLIFDQRAFPTQMAALRAAHPSFTKTDLEKDFPKEYGAAKEWDANREEHEMNAALNAPSAEAFVKLVDGKGKVKLTQAERGKREDFWNAVHSVAEEAPEGKTLDVETARKFMEQAGGDRAEAERLATEAGYTD